MLSLLLRTARRPLRAAGGLPLSLSVCSSASLRVFPSPTRQDAPTSGTAGKRFTTLTPSTSKSPKRKSVSSKPKIEPDVKKSKVVIADDVMASLYRNGDFVKELISCVLGREVDLDGTPRPAGVRTLQGVRNHGAKKLTLDEYAKFRDRAQPASRGHFRLAVLQSGKGRTVIEAQGQPQEHAAPRARVHSALDTIYAFAEEMNNADDATQKAQAVIPGTSAPAPTGSATAATRDDGTTTQHSALKHIPQIGVLTICNYVPVHVLAEDVRSSATLAGVDNASIESWINSQRSAPLAGGFDASSVVSPTRAPPGAVLEVIAENLWRSKHGLGDMCVDVTIHPSCVSLDDTAAAMHPGSTLDPAADAVTMAATDVASQDPAVAILPSDNRSAAPAATDDRDDSGNRDSGRKRRLVRVRVYACAPPVMTLRPSVQPWLPLTPRVNVAATVDAAYLHDTSALVFVHLPVIAGPAEATPPTNEWCSPTFQSSLDPESRAPGEGYRSTAGKSMSAAAAAARLHLLAVFLRSRTASIPHVVLDDPILGPIAESVHTGPKSSPDSEDSRVVRAMEGALSEAMEQAESAIKRANAADEHVKTAITTFNLEIAERDREIAERDREIAERDREIAERNREIAERNREVAELKAKLAAASGAR